MEEIINIIKDVFSNLITSVVYGAMAFVLVGIYDLIKDFIFKQNFYKLTRIDHPKKEDTFAIKCYMANSGRYDECENVYLGYPFEYMSAASLNSYLNMIMTVVDMETYPCPLTASELGEINKTQDLILLGGPFHNLLTQHFFGLTKENTNVPLYFDTFENEEATLFYKKDEEYKTAKPLKDTLGDFYCEDYGLILNIKNPYNPDKRIIALMGCRSIGVLGATYAFTKFYKDIFKTVKSDEYAVIVKCHGDRSNLDIERGIQFVDQINLEPLNVEQLIKVKDKEKINI